MGIGPRNHPLHALFQPPALIGVLLAGEALALIVSLAPGLDEGFLVRFGLASLATQWVAIGTVGTLYLLRPALVRLPPLASAPAGLGVLLLATLALAVVALQVFDYARIMDPVQSPMLFVGKMLAIALVVGLVGLVGYRNYWHARQLAVRAKQAEIDALHARLRPHFLFNALNTGIALVHAHPRETEQLLLDLADLFRAAISGREQVPLPEELALTRRYLEIERLRFGDRLQIHWDVAGPADALASVAIPPLSIQPLVENAIKHGIEPSRSGGHVVVSLRQIRGAIAIDVRNSLPAAHAAPSSGHGIGLSAVRSRIEAFTGGRGRLEVSRAEDEHVVTLILPAQDSSAGHSSA